MPFTILSFPLASRETYKRGNIHYHDRVYNCRWWTESSTRYSLFFLHFYVGFFKDDLPIIPFSELEKHKSADNLWFVRTQKNYRFYRECFWISRLAVNGLVLDVTNFRHSAGKNSLLMQAGKDCTAVFSLNHLRTLFLSESLLFRILLQTDTIGAFIVINCLESKSWES